jgi:hypothetical protein
MPRKHHKSGSLPVIESNAAGIDIGAMQIFVAVPADRDPEPVSNRMNVLMFNRNRRAASAYARRTVALRQMTAAAWIPPPVQPRWWGYSRL